MKRFLAAIALAAASLGVSMPAHAAAPAPSGTIVLNEAGPHAFGDYVTFTTTTSHLKGSTWPMVYVVCYAVDDPSLLLQGMLDHPDAAFLLGGGWSPWWDNPNHDGNCVGQLYTYSKQGNIVLLDETEVFLVSGP